MSPLHEILELYKSALKPEEDYEEIQGLDIEAPPLPKDVSPKEVEPVEEPEEGDVIEIFPSPDGMEMYLLVFRIYVNGYVELLPLSKFWELATPDDVLVSVNGEHFIVETDLGFEVPLENFPKRFGNRRIFKVAQLTPEQMQEVDDVYEGRKRGVGGMWGGVKVEFKTLESKSYFSIFVETVVEDESLAELSAFFEEHRRLASVAGEKEQTWGRKGEIEWFYDSETQRLILLPDKSLVGKEKRILLEAGEDRIVLFEGKLPEKIELPLAPESYDYSLLEESLRIEDV